MATFTLTCIGDDRAGLVSDLSAPIRAHGASWHRSQMARLGGKFAGILEKAEKQITTVGRSIGEASRKTRTIERRLRGVESLASEQAQSLLGDLAEGDAVAEEEGSDGEGDEA